MSIFSTYSTGENRVTASILAVLGSLSLRHTQRILGAMIGNQELELLAFRNQVARGGAGVPDAEIFASIRIMIETKTARNAVNLDQLRRHLAKLNASNEARRLLVVLTPDVTRPAIMDSLPPDEAIWSSFGALDQAINELLADDREVVSERDAFLLREVQSMLDEEELLAAGDEVLVVAAQFALAEYHDTAAYVCQPNRSFRDAQRMAFYTRGEIAPLVPRIVDTMDEVEFRRGAHEGPLGAVVDALVDRGLRQEGQLLKVVFLTAPEHPDTIRLAAPITNDLTSSKTGRPIAFTQGQRYVSLSRLRSSNTTSQLIG